MKQRLYLIERYCSTLHITVDLQRRNTKRLDDLNKCRHDAQR